MKEKKLLELNEREKNQIIELLTGELPVLRAKLGISQTELGNIIGISRQTYSAIETQKRKMSWNTFVSLVLFFNYNEKTRPMLASTGAFPESLRQILDVDMRENEK